MYDILMAVLSCIGGCALLPLLSGALSAFDSLGKHSALTRGELACLAVPVCGVLLSLPFEGFMGISPAQLCALFCISVCSLSLPSGGAAFSGICAALFLLKGQTPAAGLAMVIMSLLAYALRRISRVGVLLGYIAGDFFASLLIAGSFVPLIPIQTAILSALPALFSTSAGWSCFAGLEAACLFPPRRKRSWRQEAPLKPTAASRAAPRFSTAFPRYSAKKRKTSAQNGWSCAPMPQAGYAASAVSTITAGGCAIAILIPISRPWLA